MEQFSIFRIWRALVIFGLAALFTMANSDMAVADCRDDARLVDEAARAYRAAVRDVSRSCTADSRTVCEAAEQAADNALNALENAHQTLLNNCDVPPSPPSADSPGLPGDLVITEMMINPDSVLDAEGEWFEVYNPTGATFELQGLTVRDDGTDQFTIDSSLIIPPGGFVVFGRNAELDQNGGVPVDYVYSNFALSNVQDEIEIINGGVVLDRVAYSPGWPIAPGRSTSLDPGAFDAVLNDDISNWCEAVSPLPGGDTGTPGAINDDCVEVCLPLQVIGAEALDSTHVVVSFDQPIEAGTLNPIDFNILPSLVVISAVLQTGNDTSVILETGIQMPDQPYVVTVSTSIQNTCGAGVDPSANQAEFFGYPI